MATPKQGTLRGAQREDDMPQTLSTRRTDDQSMSSKMQECLHNCQECARICWETLAYCTQQGGRHVEAAHLEALLDCAQICETSTSLLARGSELHTKFCEVCAEACKRCQESCEQFGDDAQMRACADACKRSAQSCEEMARAH